MHIFVAVASIKHYCCNITPSVSVDLHIGSLHFGITSEHNTYMSCRIRKPTICICEKKGADQLCSDCTADQHLCFRYKDSAIPLLLIFKISSFWSASEALPGEKGYLFSGIWGEGPFIFRDLGDFGVVGSREQEAEKKTF